MQHISSTAKILIFNSEYAKNIKLELDNEPNYTTEILQNLDQLEEKLSLYAPDLLIIDFDKTPEIIKKIQNIPFITYCKRENFEQAIESLQLGAHTCLAKITGKENYLNHIQLIEATHNALKFNRKKQDITNTALIAKSKRMQSLIKSIKELKNARAISFIGPIGCAKKFIANYFAKLWGRTIYVIDCENSNITKIFNMIEYLIDQPTNKMFIINHPEQLSHAMQTRLAHIIHATIGNSANQWINIIDNEDEKNIIKLLHDRISIFRIMFPTLEERAEDINDITKIMQKNIAKTLNKKIRKLDMPKIINKQWPGNFKQLKTYIEQMFYISNQIETTEHADILIDEIFLNMSLKDATNLFEKIYIKKQIANKKGSIQEAAKTAQINRTTLYRKLQKDQKSAIHKI